MADRFLVRKGSDGPDFLDKPGGNEEQGLMGVRQDIQGLITFRAFDKWKLIRLVF